MTEPVAKQEPEFDALDGAGLRVGVAVGMFNRAISDPLLTWCVQGLTDSGVDPDDITVEWAPGAFELPLVAKAMAEAGMDAVVCLGAVIRGDTAHFDFVAGEAARGIQDVAVATGVPVLFGVLTTDTVEQAEERSRPDRTNKGYEAAQGAVHMAIVLRRLRKGA